QCVIGESLPLSGTSSAISPGQPGGACFSAILWAWRESASYRSYAAFPGACHGPEPETVAAYSQGRDRAQEKPHGQSRSDTGRTALGSVVITGYEVEKAQLCPLCAEPQTLAFHRDQRRPYRRCSRCLLVFVPVAHHLSPEEERGHYLNHENSPDDTAYRRFLARLEGPLSRRLSRPCTGLDFGCGPGPTLSAVLEERGHDVV